MSALYLIFTAMHVVTERWNEVHSDERGEVTEKVILVAIFAALAIAAGAIIVAKVTAKAQSISTE